MTSNNEPKIYALAPLNNGQIRVFARARGVEDCDSFLESIEKSDASVFASRPLDLVELIDFWQKYNRIGSRLELLRANIDRKLIEYDTDRARVHPLSKEKARKGAQLLAAATTLQKTSKICIPDRVPTKDGVVATKLLHNWSEDDCSTLLARPIFDEAIYGTVRFHHRSIREFLTAEWLFELLKDGKSRRQVESLLFRNQYGIDVLVPTMRSIVPWLAIMDERILNRTRQISPEALVDEGDPSQLPPTVRIQILESVCEQYASKKVEHIFFDLTSVQRFAGPDIAQSVKSLLSKYRDHKEIRILLLKMVWRGELEACREETLKFALDRSMDDYTRTSAIRAMAATGTQDDKKELIEKCLNDSEQDQRQILEELIDNFAPDLISTAQLVFALKTVKPPSKFEITGLSEALNNYVDRCTPSKLFELIVSFKPLLDEPPFVDRGYYEISKQYSWLLEHAAKACEKLILSKHRTALSDNALAIISLSSQSHNYNTSRRNEHKLQKLVPEWSELNYQLFWHDVSNARNRLDKKKGKRLTDWWQARIFGYYWRFESQDFERIKGDISSKTFIDDQLVALSLAFQIYKENERPRKWLAQLKKSVMGNTELEAALHTSLHPPAQSDEMKRWKRQDAGCRRRQKVQEQKAEESRKKWKKWLKQNTYVLLDTSVAKKGAVWNAQLYLHERMRELSKERNRWARGNWNDLISDQCQEVAEAFRDGVLAYWREYTPKISSEGTENPNSTPHAVVIGLTGLEIESQTENWASNLTRDEAKLACRYALWEMNGFPSWFPQLYKQFPDIVSESLLKEIKWELAEYDGETDSHYVLSDLTWHGDWIKYQLARDLFSLIQSHEPKHDRNLSECLSIVLESTDISDKEFSAIAEKKVKTAHNKERCAMWFAAWVSVEPTNAVKALEQYLSSLSDKDESTQFAMHFAVSLIGDRRSSIRARDNFKTAETLKKLYLIMHQYIRIEDDINRGGGVSYSPTLRDDAQIARSQLFSLLLEIPGKQTYLAINDLEKVHPGENAEAWMRQHARNRAAKDADFDEWSTEDINEFAAEYERKPKNHRELFDLVMFRLFDLKDDLEQGDSSIASILLKVDDEPELRKFIGGWLREHSNSRYSTSQEEELADAKKPDIRIHGMGFDAPVPIELKMPDQSSWSGSKLFERLENQLCGDYLRDRHSDSGVFLLVCRGKKKSWRHPHTGKAMVFHNLLESLQEHANEYIEDKEGIEHIKVIGIDLTKRKKQK